MGTISEKLTYLNDTKQLLKDSINSLGGNITSQTTFRQYATELDSIYSNLPKVSGTGSILSLSPTIKGRLSSTPKGDTYQFSTTGKQLYDISTADYTYKCSLSNGIYTTDALTTSARSVNFGYDANNNYTINDGETYYVSADIRLKSGTATNVNVLRFNVSGLTTSQISNPNFTSQFQRYAFSCANNSGSAITTGRFLFQPSSTNLDNAVFEITNVMVSTSSNTSYEPYTGAIVSPSPSYPQEIQSVTGLQKVGVCGKNLFDKDNANILNAYINSNSNSSDYKKIISSNNSRTIYISCKSNTTYTVSKIAGQRFVVASCNNVPEANVLCTNEVHNLTGASLTITTGANDKYLAVFYYLSTADTSTEEQIRNSIQIEVGSTATTYEPYQSQEYEINLGKNLLNIESTDISSSGSSKEVDDNDLILTSTTQGTSYIGFNIRNIKPNTEYTFSYNANAEYYAGYQIRSYNKDNVNTSIKGTTSATDLSFSFTTPSDTSYLKIYLYASNDSGVTIGQKTTYSNIQLEEGSQSSYSPYFTPIHLYEGDQIIGTPDNWSIYRVNGEFTLNGSESGWSKSSNTNVDKYLLNNSDYSANNNSLCNYFTYQPSNNIVGRWYNNVGVQFVFNFAEAGTTTLEDWKTWLSTHNLELVQPLATETTEPITNTELIEDLNNFYNAKSYNGQTNISVEGDLPMILDVSAIKGE